MSIFNIRVYGLLINEKSEVLVTDEFRFGTEMTKFPGGGLIWGEGTLDCLQREFREELGCEIDEATHFYTTDFFQLSGFHKDHQLISIYYKVRAQGLKETDGIGLFKEKDEANHPFKDKKVFESQSFRWIAVQQVNESDFTFPIDKKVAKMLKATFLNPGK